MSAAAAKYFQLPGSEQFGLAIIVSVGLHVVLIGILAFWPGWPSHRRQMFAPAYNVTLVSPKVLAQPAPAPPAQKKVSPIPKPAAPPKPEPKPKEAVGLKKDVKTERIKPKEAKPKADPNKLLNQRLRRLQSKVKEQERLDSAIDRLQTRVAKNTAASGAFAAGKSSQVDTTSLRFQVFYTEMWERVRHQWVLPEALVAKPQGLEAILVARILRNGKLQKVELEKGSGNTRFDASCMRAVERAAPFPPLPSFFRGRSLEVGLRFRPEDMNN